VKGIIAQAGLILGMLLLVTILLPPTGDSIQLALAGDIMLGRGVAQAHSDGDWIKALEALASIFSKADFSFANLESPITEAPLVKVTYDLRAPPRSIQSLSSSNISLLSLSNNHIADAGQKGIADTLNALASVGILPIGPSQDPVILQALKVDLAWFAFADTNRDRDLDLEMVEQSLESVRDRVDYIFVSIHWGNETKTVPNDRQRALAQELADFGADIILGHHPHVLQPVEKIWGEGRGRPTLVAYSLGNALFDQGAPPAARQAALLLLDLGPLSVKGACAVPFQMDPKTWNVIPASSGVEERILSRLIVKTCVNN
jgi:poly-gamma-glutamate synthesis protein (capsule biosynthesis protein)